MKHKRWILQVAVLSLALCCGGELSTTFSQDTHYGIKAGVSWSLFRNASPISDALKEAIPGVKSEPFFFWSASYYTSREILKRLFATQMEIIYTRTGESWNIGNDDHFQLRTDYLQIPFLFKFMMPVSQAVVPNVYIGPAIAFALRSRATNIQLLPAQLATNSAFFKNVNIRQSNFDYARNPIDVGFMTGFGVQIPAGPGTFDVDLRYNHGSLNVFNFNDGGKIRNYSFLAYVGYSL
jgi:hypothetical protein